MKKITAKNSLPPMAFLFLLVFISNASGQQLAYQGTHILTYSTMGLLAEAYQKRTGITVEVMGGGCSDGVVAITKGRAKMGGLCCPLKPEEEARNLVPHAVARDIKVAIVNFINPVVGLSSQQLRDIHQGKITNWKELGWIDRPIAVIYRRHCLDRREPVREFLELDDELKNLTPKAIVVRTDMQLIDYVKRFPTAIGITSDVFVKNKETEVSRLAIDGEAPTAANVEAGRYPFAAVIHIVTNGAPDPETRKFLDFVGSPAGQQIIRKNLATAP
ncbi:MAG: substrate-binding domain-containing protein [Desulfobulbaceae bacterium]|nr:substrate-binding domain-containing protein [Desulfobulbaceae bacterium]